MPRHVAAELQSLTQFKVKTAQLRDKLKAKITDLEALKRTMEIASSTHFSNMGDRPNEQRVEHQTRFNGNSERSSEPCIS